MPVPTPGAIGSIETPDDKVKEMALQVVIEFFLLFAQSQHYKCPKCGEIQKIIKPRV